MFSGKIFVNVFFILIFLTSCKNEGKVTGENVRIYSFKADRKSEVFHLNVDGKEVPVTIVPNIDEDEVVGIVKQYKKLPPYCWIENRFITVHYAHIASDHNPDIEILVNQPISKYTFYPKMLGIEAVVDGASMKFSAPSGLSPYLLLSIDELPMFVLIVDAPETEKPESEGPDIVNLRDFIESQEEPGDYSDVFRRAIERLNGSGKVLFIPGGEYLTDEIVIQNCKNLNIYVDAGAMIRIKTSPAGANIQNRGIWIDRSENIKIYGRGVLDHQGYENFKNGRNDYHYGFPGYDFYSKFEDIPENDPFLQSPVLITYSKDITVDGLVIRNSRNYNFNVRHSDHIIVRNLKILTPAGSVPENTDGINVGSVLDMLVENCLVYCNDDPLAFGHNLMPYDNRPVKNLTFRKVTGWNPRANGVRIGWAFNNCTGKVLFSDCHFSGMDDSAIIIHSHQHAQGQPDALLYYGTIRFEDCTFDDVAKETHPMIDVKGAAIKNLEFVRVSFDNKPRLKGVINGDEKKMIGKLLFKDVTIAGEKITYENVDMEMNNIRKIIIE